MPNIRNLNYYVPSRSRRYSYPEMYGQKSIKDYRIEDEDLYYEQNGGDNSGIGNSDSDGMGMYSKPMEQINPHISEMQHSYFHNRIPPLRANITSQCEISPTLPIMNYSQISQYTRPTGIPVSINNNCYNATPVRDKSVYVNYHNPVYECSLNQSQYQMNQQRLLDATHVSSMNRPPRMYTLKKKKSSGIPTVATPRYVRAGRHNSVISMPLATKVEAPRRPVCTQTSPHSGGFLDKPIRKDSFIHIKRPKTAANRRPMVPLTCAATNNYEESQDSSEVQENFHLELRNQMPNPKKIVSKTSNGTEIEIAKYQKMFVQNNKPSKKLDDKARKTVKIKKSKSSTHSSLKSSPQPEKENSARSIENKDENDTDSLLNNLINDIEGAFNNETLDGKSQIKQMMDKMKAATENGIRKMNTTPTGSPSGDKTCNVLLKDLKIDQNSSSSYNDYLTKKALNQAYQPNLTGYQKCTSSGLGFDPKISNMQLDELNKAASIAEMELHRSKNIVVNLIDREISRTNSNQAIPVEPLASTLNIDAGDAIDYVQKSNNMLKEMQITEAVTNTLVGTKYPKASLIDTGRENKYLRWLKKARKNHLKNIHRELEQLEELDETIDPSN